MYGREQRVLLRHYLERGLTKAEVARELGVSRRTFAPRKSHPGASRSKSDVMFGACSLSRCRKLRVGAPER